MSKCWLVILLLPWCVAGLAAQQGETYSIGENRSPQSSVSRENPRIEEIIKSVEEGIRTGSIAKFGNTFGTVVSVSIGSVDQGSLSTNQTISILADYFAILKAISFHFSLVVLNRPVPYATGRFMCIQKGNKESVQIYISLTRQNSRWVISQFNIY